VDLLCVCLFVGDFCCVLVFVMICGFVMCLCFLWICLVFFFARYSMDFRFFCCVLVFVRFCGFVLCLCLLWIFVVFWCL